MNRMTQRSIPSKDGTNANSSSRSSTRSSSTVGGKSRCKSDKSSSGNTNSDKNDETFLSLLSSQRELLHRLNRESTRSNGRQPPTPAQSDHQQQARPQLQQQEGRYYQQQELYVPQASPRQMMNTHHHPSHLFARHLVQQHVHHYQHVQNFLQMQQLSMNQSLQEQHYQSQSQSRPEPMIPATSIPPSSPNALHTNTRPNSFNMRGEPGLSPDPFSLMNRPIVDRPGEKRNSLDLLYATRRLSMGVGNDMFVLPHDEEDVGPDDMMDGLNIKEVKGELFASSKNKTDDPSGTSKSKRRRSSLGLLGDVALLFEDDPKEATRRLSLSNSPWRFAKAADAESGHARADGSIGVSQQVSEGESRSSTSVRLDPKVDLPTLKGKIETFATAMDKSTKSQQEIHDWDRKMGLKRSHSKTMRLSMRSRKKLRTSMKKEMTTICNAIQG